MPYSYSVRASFVESERRETRAVLSPFCREAAANWKQRQEADPMDRHPDHTAEIPRVTIEMGGPNIVIRSTPAIDRECTDALTHAVNAAADTDDVVVIDPQPIRCDDSFASSIHRSGESACGDHADCRPVEAEVVARGVIRIAGEHSSWMIDVSAGRYCQTDHSLDVRFIDPSAWTPVIAVCVTPTSMSALTRGGVLVTSRRAHRDRVTTA
jgi:hypothetical protein